MRLFKKATPADRQSRLCGIPDRAAPVSCVAVASRCKMRAAS